MSETSQPEDEAEKPPVRITMRVGSVEFEIECRQDQVQDMIQKILSSATEYASKPILAPQERMPPPRAETCRSIVEKLWREGWFGEPRSLDAIHNEMTRIGYHYDRTAVAHVLLDLVRDGLLTREGKPRRYVYIQKRPPSSN